MVKLKKLRLQDYCGYRDITFDFTNDNILKQLCCFYGPNGCGKSTLLQAINMVSNAHRFATKETDMLFRSVTYHHDYDSSYAGIYKESINNMQVTGVFDCDGEDKEVVIRTTGVEKNELYSSENDAMGYCYLVDADHPNNKYRFQLHAEMKDKFLALAEIVYGLPCSMDTESPDLEDEGENFFTDLVIEKHDGSKVHFKRMSDGEKKIATLLRDLCNPIYMAEYDIILLDNIVMHVYFERHARMIDKLLEFFPDKQFFMTTHSPILVGCEPLNIPAHLPDKFLYNIEEYKIIEGQNVKSKIV